MFFCVGGTDRQAGIRGRAGFLFFFFSLFHTGASWLPQQASIVAMEGLPAKHPWSLKYGLDLNMDSGLLFVRASGLPKLLEVTCSLLLLDRHFGGVQMAFLYTYRNSAPGILNL